ncbi:retrovirus-related pol polyprotein from transposon TNT 1-94 [Tanacetum coccineum]
MQGLSECKTSESNVGRIQVKDIIKKVEDYLKTYSSAGMDISYVVDENLPQLLDSRGGSHVTNVPAFDKEDFTSWKVRFLVFLDGLEPYLLKTLEDGPFVPMSSLSTSENPLPKRQNQWSNAESRLANQDKRLKSIIISCLPNDVMKSVIKCKTAKEMWNDLILAHEGPSDTRDTKIAALRLKFNAFKSLEGEKVNGTFTRLKCLLNDLENNGVTIPQAEVNATFVNSLPRKWLSMNQTQRANNSIKNDSLATLYGKYNYEEGLIDQIYDDSDVEEDHMLPLVTPTKLIMEMSVGNYEWHEFFPNVTHNMGVVISIWAPFVMVSVLENSYFCVYKADNSKFVILKMPKKSSSKTSKPGLQNPDVATWDMPKKSSSKPPKPTLKKPTPVKEKPSSTPKSFGQEIDDIFSKKRKKPEQQNTKKSDKRTRKDSKDIEPVPRREKLSKTGGSNVDMFESEIPARPKKKTADGLVIYSEEELGFGKTDAGEFNCFCNFLILVLGSERGIALVCASLDGDADRFIYFTVILNGNNKINLVDGDKIVSLFALFIKDQLSILIDDKDEYKPRVGLGTILFLDHF